MKGYEKFTVSGKVIIYASGITTTAGMLRG